MDGPYCGCPWQVSNPEKQHWVCEMLIAQRSKDYKCMKEKCDQYVKHSLMSTQFAEMRKKISELQHGVSPGSRLTKDVRASTTSVADGGTPLKTDPASHA